MKILVVLLGLVSVSAQAALIEDTVTVTFANESPEKVKWQGIDLATKTVFSEPKFGTSNWHVRLREGYLGTNNAKVMLNTGVAYSKIDQAPKDTGLYTSDSEYDPLGPAPKDWYNSVLITWFSYHFWGHNLEAKKNHVFFIHTPDDHYAKLQVVDYIKNGYAYRDIPQDDGDVETEELPVAPKDNLIHVKVRFTYNTVAGNQALK